MKKANRVPELAMSASWPTGRKAAKKATATPVIMVTMCGVFHLGWILAKKPGSRPSRAITKKMRVWPNSMIRMTEGSARKAAMPIRSPIRS